MEIGILGGTGPAGSGLAVRLASVGVRTVVGSRDEVRARETCAALQERWPGRQLALEGRDNPGAAEADVVVIATPWDSAAATAAAVAKQLDGKVVISMANALARVGDEFVALALPRGSVAAHVQAGVPGALVAAAFHHLPARSLARLDDPLVGDVLVCSDHRAAWKATEALIGRMGGLRALDAGSLSAAAAVEALTAVLLQLNVRYRARAGLRLTGIRSDAPPG
ncbi:MAG: NADPH-dependent F420 reductase [Acidimicrobiales bacterium]